MTDLDSKLRDYHKRDYPAPCCGFGDEWEVWCPVMQALRAAADLALEAAAEVLENWHPHSAALSLDQGCRAILVDAAARGIRALRTRGGCICSLRPHRFDCPAGQPCCGRDDGTHHERCKTRGGSTEGK